MSVRICRWSDSECSNGCFNRCVRDIPITIGGPCLRCGRPNIEHQGGACPDRSEQLHDLFKLIQPVIKPGPAAWRRPDHAGGWVITQMPRVAEIWKEQGATVEELYPAATQPKDTPHV